jgi:FRG domain
MPQAEMAEFGIRVGGHMPADHLVSSLDEAVDLARQWQANGSHKWFRGQARLWPLLSSLGRRFKAGTAAEAQARIGEFNAWAGQIPELRYLLEEEHVHAFFAVLQHYGVPTHYIDFSTEPEIAGFFAAHDSAAIPGKQGCVIAVDPENFVGNLRVIAEVKGLPVDDWPELVSVTVVDLWRMQAQSGHFIYLPLDEVENWYGYDRIVFTHDGRPHPIPVEKIYPARKSSIEIKLDEFFTAELMRNNQTFLTEMFDQWTRQGLRPATATFDTPDEGAQLNPGAGPHPSWFGIDPRWFFHSRQTYSAATGDAPQVELKVIADHGAGLVASVRENVQALLVADPLSREKAVRWNITYGGRSDQRSNARVERVWDGMRGLPYSTEQIVAAIAATIEMSTRRQTDVNDDTNLELASRQWVTSRARVSTARIQRAYRDDLSTVLQNPVLAETPRLLLQAVQNPALVFEFGKLVDLFATDIIPAQVRHDRYDLAVFFSPATVPIIGIA